MSDVIYPRDNLKHRFSFHLNEYRWFIRSVTNVRGFPLVAGEFSVEFYDLLKDSMVDPLEDHVRNRKGPVSGTLTLLEKDGDGTLRTENFTADIVDVRIPLLSYSSNRQDGFVTYEAVFNRLS